MPLNDSMILIPSGEIAPLNQLSFRKTVLFYLKTNAKPRLLLKFMQISRYFRYREFPYMVVRDLRHDKYDGWEYLQLEIRFRDVQTLDLDNLAKPLWIRNEIYLLDVNDRYFISKLLSKTAVCDVKNLTIVDQQIKINEFQMLISSNAVERVLISITKVSYDNGSVVPIEEIVKMLTNIKKFEWMFNDPASEITPTSTAKIIKYLNPSILTHFELWEIPETFDFELFSEFMDKYPMISFRLHFYIRLPDEYAKILQAYIDKLIETGEFKNRQILFDFPQQKYKCFMILEKHFSY